MPPLTQPFWPLGFVAFFEELQVGEIPNGLVSCVTPEKPLQRSPIWTRCLPRPAAAALLVVWPVVHLGLSSSPGSCVGLGTAEAYYGASTKLQPP